MGIQQMLLAVGTPIAKATVSGGGVIFSCTALTPSLNFPKSPGDGALFNSSFGSTGTQDFGLQADGAYAGGQNGAFTSITVGLTAGGTRTYTAAAAAWNAGTLSWSWGTGSSPVWTANGSYSFQYT